MMKCNITKFTLFSITNFFPIIIFIMLFGIGVILLPLICFIQNDIKAGFSGIMFASLFFMLPIGLIFLSYRLCMKYNSWFKRGLLIYGAWLLLSYVEIFVLTSAIGGASMATVDGSTSVTERIIQYIEQTGVFVLGSQIFIVPWTFISVIIMKRFALKYF